MTCLVDWRPRRIAVIAMRLLVGGRAYVLTLPPA